MLAAQIKFLHAFSQVRPLTRFALTRTELLRLQKTYTPAQWEVEKQKLAAST
jgi:hypothetical protein